jgi:DNA invertase Pin-like site-specific DNA recombinase
VNKSRAIAYFRTSSAVNVGPDKDSERRQREAVSAYAEASGLVIAAEYYDAAVSGADRIDARVGFVAAMERCRAEGISVILVENASRFARDLTVQLTGHALLQNAGIELIPVDAPSHFTDPTPTAVLIQQILGAVSQFDRASTVLKLKGARDRKRQATGRCEGRKPVPGEVVAMAKRIAETDERPSLRVISAKLAAAGHLSPSNRPYHPSSIKQMLEKTRQRAAA